MDAQSKQYENEINEITIIYNFGESMEIELDKEFIEKVRHNIGETISKEKLFGEIFVNNNKNICKIIIDLKNL